MARIFISYKRRTELDEPLAGEIFRRLTQGGHEVFRDQESLGVGERWAQAIQQHLESCDFLILLLSQESVVSEMVAEEVRIARHAQASRGIEEGILPVRVAYDGEPPYHLSAVLSGIQYVLWHSPADTGRLLDQLLAAVARAGTRAEKHAWRTRPMIDSEPITTDAARPAAAANPVAPLEQAGGAMPESPYYVERNVDAIAERERQANAFALVIRGPRQVGKSSLLGRLLRAARSDGQAVVMIDLQRFSESTRADGEALLLEFCAEIEYQLNLPVAIDTFWTANQRRDPPVRATRYLEREVFPALAGRKLVIGLDECDVLLDRAGGCLLFPLLRSWVNQARGRNPPQWAPFNLAMVVGTEPAMLIPDLHQSPFNVGVSIEVDDFASGQIEQLHTCYGQPLPGVGDRQRFYELLHGHPYLTRLALNQIAERRWNYPADEASADSETGLFGDHLRTLLARLHTAGLAGSLRRLLAGQRCPDDDRHRLIEGGLIAERDGHVVARNGLYHRYFTRVLNA